VLLHRRVGPVLLGILSPRVQPFRLFLNHKKKKKKNPRLRSYAPSPRCKAHHNSQDASSTVPTSSRSKLGLIYAYVGHYVSGVWSPRNELPSPTKSPLQKSSLQSHLVGPCAKTPEPTDKLTWLTGLDGEFILTRRPGTGFTDVRLRPTRSCWKPTTEGPPT
jgi:hypothetical protein